jgi:hypothetical protein
MQPLPRPSVTPLYSFCSVRPNVVPRYVSFSETVQAVWRWLRGVEPGWRERAREARTVERLAAEMEEDGETINPEISESHQRNESHYGRTG